MTDYFSRLLQMSGNVEEFEKKPQDIEEVAEVIDVEQQFSQDQTEILEKTTGPQVGPEVFDSSPRDIQDEELQDDSLEREVDLEERHEPPTSTYLEPSQSSDKRVEIEDFEETITEHEVSDREQREDQFSRQETDTESDVIESSDGHQAEFLTTRISKDFAKDAIQPREHIEGHAVLREVFEWISSDSPVETDEKREQVIEKHEESLTLQTLDDSQIRGDIVSETGLHVEEHKISIGRINLTIEGSHHERRKLEKEVRRKPSRKASSRVSSRLSRYYIKP